MARFATIVFGLLALATGLLLLGGGLIAIFNAMTTGRSDAALQAGVALLPMLLGLAFATAGRHMVWPRREAESPKKGSRGRGAALAVLFAFVLLGGGGIWFRVANDDLIELTARREADLTALRPVLLRYRDERGRYPKSLDDLVPDYIKAIPASLRNRADAANVLRISYHTDEHGARVVYHGHRGPDSRRTFDVETGKVVVDQ